MKSAVSCSNSNLLKLSQSSLLVGMRTPNSTPTSDLVKTMSSSPNNSMFLTQNLDPTLIQNLLVLSQANQSSNSKNLRRSESFTLNMSQSPLLRPLSASIENTKEEYIEEPSLENEEYDEIDNEVLEHTSKNAKPESVSNLMDFQMKQIKTKKLKPMLNRTTSNLSKSYQ